MPIQTNLFEEEVRETPVVLSYGLGVDSTSILLRWLHEPDSRDFPLESLTVLTAMVGDEFADTKRLVETHILHRLREFRVRYVQVGRAGPLQAQGIQVLDDSREPKRLFIEGGYTLSQELQSNGTVPQVASGQRRCTHHFKGYPLTAWTDQEFGDHPVRKVIGYNADEKARALKSEGYSTDTRKGEYPLIEWEWGRKKCEEYIAQIVGETWRKSCCTFCPFAAGKPDVLDRYRESPNEAAEALFLEYVSLTLNPKMTLYSRRSLRSVLEKDGNVVALRLFQEHLNETPWAVYRVRRIVWAKGRADRKTERLQEGSRDKVVSVLLKQGAKAEGDHLRLHVRKRGETYPTIEEMLVACPAVVDDKCRPKFQENWQRMSGGGTLW